ncbi:uncharacterized protein LOC121235424 [Juglans microcarpa x Juglans regia]|uniref:uncharacterized protein LOC121235424 n=1 Tax=Juglans microcarpa x Juglans regia TaxID=2249226 RepID=UPI001B7E28D8|nr:uncharacterized protein LOC121235424 [Juglans microcarpa x Juglans regia]
MRNRRGTCSDEEMEDKRWRKIWDLEVPGVVKLFLWKARSNLLPTKKNLFKRKVVQDPRCPICFAKEELVVHALWECTAANDIWADERSIVQKWSCKEEDFMELWEKLMARLNMSQLEEMTVLFKRVWFKRNESVFEERLSCPRKILISAKEGLEEYKKSQRIQRKDDHPSSAASNRHKWQKLEADFVKVNWNASLDLKSKRMGMRIMIRDEKGEAMVAVCDQRKYVQNPTMAECHALWKALELCNDLNIQKVLFEGDANGIVTTVNSEEEDLSSVDPLVEDMRSVFKNRPNWSLQFAYREKNIVAYTLVMEALKLVEVKI